MAVSAYTMDLAFADLLDPTGLYAARADAGGNVDESTVLSATGSWATRASDLSGQPWDFLRFEVQFELDVSGDSYHPSERSPVLDFLKIPIDFRR